MARLHRASLMSILREWGVTIFGLSAVTIKHSYDKALAQMYCDFGNAPVSARINLHVEFFLTIHNIFKQYARKQRAKQLAIMRNIS